MDLTSNSENDESGGFIAPQEACNRITEVVQEAMRKMEMIAEENMRMYKKACLSVDACDREIEDKTREVAEMQLNMQRKRQQVDELERVVRLKLAEADMFQLKAQEAGREAERLQRIALAESEKTEEDYASKYLKLRLNEAEAEKKYLLEKIKLQESSRIPQNSGGADSSQTLMVSKIQDLLKNVYNVPPPNSEAQSGDRQALGSAP